MIRGTGDFERTSEMHGLMVFDSDRMLWGSVNPNCRSDQRADRAGYYSCESLTQSRHHRVLLSRASSRRSGSGCYSRLSSTGIANRVGCPLVPGTEQSSQAKTWKSTEFLIAFQNQAVLQHPRST